MAKKDFSKVNSNPDYISSRRAQALAQEPTTQAPQPEAPEGYILKTEPKSRRLQLLIAPSLYDKIKTAADAANPKKSVNLLINEVLAEAMKDK